MLEEALHFREESDALLELIADLPEEGYDRPTQFNNWTLNHILQHLHFFNVLANQSLRDEGAFAQRFGMLIEKIKIGGTLVAATDEMLDGLKGYELRDQWRDNYRSMAEHWLNVDGKQRVKWAGPSMSARSSISARLMETWAHAQEVFDLMGVKRTNRDRIKSIVVLGINTFGWTFANRKEPVPELQPYVRLVAPSGEIWEWGEPSKTEYVSGLAEAFCQVVTQVRNIADTELEVGGLIATQWMSKAQCFAGEPRTPPKPGERHLVDR